MKKEWGKKISVCLLTAVFFPTFGYKLQVVAVTSLNLQHQQLLAIFLGAR